MLPNDLQLPPGPSGDRADRELHPIAETALRLWCKQPGIGLDAKGIDRLRLDARSLIVADDAELDWASRSTLKAVGWLRNVAGDATSADVLCNAFFSEVFQRILVANQPLLAEIEARAQKGTAEAYRRLTGARGLEVPEPPVEAGAKKLSVEQLRPTTRFR